MSSHAPGFYGRLALATMRHRGLTLLIVAVITAIAGGFVSRLTVDSDILGLMPQEEPTTIALKKLDVEEGGVNVLTIAVEGEDTERREAFMVDLETRVRALPDVDYVLWRLDPATTSRLGMLQVPVDDLTNLRDRLKAALQLGPAIANPFIAARVLDLGPLTERLTTAGKGISLTSVDGVSRMIVRPTGSAHDLPFARRFMHEVEGQITAADPAKYGVTLKWIGGAYRHNVEDYEGIVRDIGRISAGAAVLVLAILFAAYRSPRALVVLFVPLLVANVWTLGVASATVGSLNTFTSFVNAVLIGIGVEFGVHVYSRYKEIREAGHTVEDSVVRAWDLVGGACTSACLTSSAGFAALFAAHFAGFRQLGWFLSLGLVLTLITVLTLTPILLTWLDRAPTPAPAAWQGRWHGRRRRPASYRLAPMTMLVLASITLVSGLLIRRIDFEYDLSELRRAGLAYSDLDEQERALARDSYSPLVATFPTAEAVMEAHVRLEKRIADGKFPEVARVMSIRTVLPVDMDVRVALLQEIAAMSADPNASYLPPQVRENLARIREQPIRALTAEDLPEPLQHVLGARDGKHRLMLVPAGNMWDMREAEQLAAGVDRELPGIEVAGEYLTLGVLYRVMQHDAPIIGGIALLLVSIFTFLDLRSIKAGLGAMAVLGAGMAWWGALLVLSDIRISMVNFVGVPIVLGIGIDVMIHLIHRMKQEGPGRILKALATTGYASALGTATTVVAFAALSFASSQGVRSLGLLVLLGESAVTVAGLVLVPLGFATQWRLQGKHPSAHHTEDDVTHP